MQLESAMRAAQSGLKTQGEAIAVIGDNIANSETVGYKTGRAEFSDVMGEVAQNRNSQIVPGAGVGDGVTLSRIRTLFDNGIVEPTSRDLDVAISGNGFFQVGSVADTQYSRKGNFEIDSATGSLVTTDGRTVLGFQGEGTTLGPVNMYEVNTAGKVTTALTLFGNLNSSEITGAGIPAQANSFRELGIAAQYSSSTGVYDSLGARREVQMFYFKTAPGVWTAQAYMDGAEIEGGTRGVPVAVGDPAQLSFDGAGKLTAATAGEAKITATPAYSNGATAGNFTIDLSNFSQFAGGSIVNQVAQDGVQAGDVKSYSFDTDGSIYAELSGGDRSKIGKLQLADFRNKDGLIRAGSGVFSATEAAGDKISGSASSNTFGSIEGRSLERSTVELPDQFVTMIVQQRAYQASSKVFSTASEMIQEALGLKR